MQPSRLQSAVRDSAALHTGRYKIILLSDDPKRIVVNREQVDRLLDQVGLLRHPCDLDLLLFFARHPRTLATSEQLALWLGYESKLIADSLEVLLAAKHLTRTQKPTHAARMYVFDSSTTGDWLPPLIEMTSTRDGLLSMKEALTLRGMNDVGGPGAGLVATPSRRRSRPFVVRRKSDAARDVKAG